MAKEKAVNTLDPDRYVITKEEIVEFCDSVLEKWNKKKDENTDIIFAMKAVRTSVLWTDENSLKAIWEEILKWAFAKQYKNTIVQTKEVIKQQTKQPEIFLEGSIEFWENHYKNKVKPENWAQRYSTLAKEYADNTNKQQKEKIYKEYLGLYNVLRKKGEKLEDSGNDKVLNF